MKKIKCVLWVGSFLLSVSFLNEKARSELREIGEDGYLLTTSSAPQPRKIPSSEEVSTSEEGIYSDIHGVLPPRERIFSHRLQVKKTTPFNPLRLLKRGIAEITDFFVAPQICRTAKTKTFRRAPPFQQPLPPHRPLPLTPFEQNIAQLRKRMPRIPLVLEPSPTDPTYLVPAKEEAMYEPVPDLSAQGLYVADWNEDYIVIGTGNDFQDETFYRHHLPGKVGQLRSYDVWLKERD